MKRCLALLTGAVLLLVSGCRKHDPAREVVLYSSIDETYARRAADLAAWRMRLNGHRGVRAGSGDKMIDGTTTAFDNYNSLSWP